MCDQTSDRRGENEGLPERGRSCPPYPFPLDPNSNPQTPAIVVALILNLLDAIPYGLAVFPARLAVFGPLGVTVCLLSTGVAQAVLGVGSGFSFALGSMMVENIPFWHTLADHILDSGEFADPTGALDPAAALPTVLVFYGISTVLVGGLFLLMAELQASTLTPATLTLTPSIGLTLTSAFPPPAFAGALASLHYLSV